MAFKTQLSFFLNAHKAEQQCNKLNVVYFLPKHGIQLCHEQQCAVKLPTKSSRYFGVLAAIFVYVNYVNNVSDFFVKVHNCF